MRTVHTHIQYIRTHVPTHIRMYVCMYVHTYVYIHYNMRLQYTDTYVPSLILHRSIYTAIWRKHLYLLNTNKYNVMHVSKCAHAYVHAYIHMHMYMCTVHVHAYVRTYYVYIHMYTCTYIRTYMNCFPI